MSLLSRGRLAALAVIAVGLPLLAGCTTVPLQPAPSANTVACADVTVRLPSSLEGHSLRDTNAQATAAWGSPAGVLLTCGITTPTVSDLPCNPVDGVDWLTEYKGKGGTIAVYTTYGREPGVQVVVDKTLVPSDTNVLFDLSTAVGTLPQTRECQSASDVPAP